MKVANDISRKKLQSINRRIELVQSMEIFSIQDVLYKSNRVAALRKQKEKVELEYSRAVTLLKYL